MKIDIREPVIIVKVEIFGEKTNRVLDIVKIQELPIP